MALILRHVGFRHQATVPIVPRMASMTHNNQHLDSGEAGAADLIMLHVVLVISTS